eukprot:COSAG01_NODE_1835_length_9084_cov_87.179481_12_plen_249_part_00
MQESSAEDLRKLLELISPDVSRDDWLRVGNFLKHQTHLDGFELWSQWSRRSDQCSTKLPYEWQMLGGGGRPCTLGTLIFLARKDHDDAVAQWQRETGGDEPEVARTKEALDYAGVMEWNKHCIYIEATHSYLWLSGGDAPVPITKDHGISNNMKRYSTLKLADWLEHPDATRCRSQGYFPSRTPTPEQLAPDVLVLGCHTPTSSDCDHATLPQNKHMSYAPRIITQLERRCGAWCPLTHIGTTSGGCK